MQRVTRNLFKIAFDHQTPRPHLIIHLGEEGLISRTNWQGLNSLSDTSIRELIAFVNSKSYLHSDAVLSFHTGFFQSASHFHAHLVLPLQSVLPLLDSENDVCDEGNVCGANRQKFEIEMKRYQQKKEVDGEKFWQKDVQGVNFKQIPVREVNTNAEYDILFDDILPRIRFRLREIPADSEEAQAMVLQAMSDFATKHGLFNRKVTGSHICLRLEKGMKGEGSYIAATPAFCYTYNPDREAWLQRLRASNLDALIFLT